MALTDFIMALASGMTIKYFPIFFKDQVGLAPASMCLIYAVSPIALSGSAYISQVTSRFMGRASTLALNRGIGIGLLYILAAHPEIWRTPALVIPLYIVRSSMMNCNYALKKSILSDYEGLSKGKSIWKAVDLFTSYAWAASPILGGWLIKAHCFQVTLFMTVALQLLGWVYSLLLLPLVPRNELSMDELYLIFSKLKTMRRFEARESS